MHANHEKESENSVATVPHHSSRLLHRRCWRKIDDKVENARESLEARRATLGDRHPRTLGSINHLASLLQDQGKLDEAAPLFGEALQGFRATLDDRHPDTLSSINNLATLSLAQGRLMDM